MDRHKLISASGKRCRDGATRQWVEVMVLRGGEGVFLLGNSRGVPAMVSVERRRPVCVKA